MENSNENTQNQSNPPIEPNQPNPRRRKRKSSKVFMESYLPVILLVAIVALIVVFIINGNKNKKAQEEESRKESQAAEQAQQEQKEQHDAEAAELMEEAKKVAATYDFEAAIEVLDSFSGNMYDYDDMLLLRDQYMECLENPVQYSAEDVVNLSLQVLIAEPERAFADSKYGKSYKNNFITTEEFSNLLEQLYANGYVLVDMDDIVNVTRDDAGNTAFSSKTLSLPQGKKPLILTQTQVNYYTYMVDPDQDGIPDKNGAGFACRLILEDGEFKNELVKADGSTAVGDFDLVPILENFLKEHPDFSYRGARPILALTGYNGVFGYRGATLQDAVPLVEELKARGYTMAFYTYNNSDYNASSVSDIKKEVEKWNEKIVPVLGETPYLVYARSADIAAPGNYSGEKFNTLHSLGFRYFLGFCTDAAPWFVLDTTYARQGRLMVTASNLMDSPELFAGIFDPSAVLVESR